VSASPSTLVLSRGDLFDALGRAALGLIFAFDAGVCFNRALALLWAGAVVEGDVRLLSQAVAVLSIGSFALMVACLYAVRLPPIRTAVGIYPRAAAILGGFLMCGLLLFNPRADLPLAASVAASMLVLTGNGFALYILFHLGRSFSILPESRKLVTSGPYQLVRHPLYLAEAVATLGVVIEFLSVWAILLMIAQIALQIVRIHCEEAVLAETFSDYIPYTKRTWRLLPMVY
jgi:protein-S-isoprenylcysteine O-methyltransferase Ste14